MSVKGRWADWAAIALGLTVGLSWTVHGMYGFSGGMFFLLGLGVILAGVMSLTRPAALTSEMGVIAGGVVLFLLPWLLGFTHIPGAALTAWVGGGAITILGIVGLLTARQNRKRDPALAWNPQSDAGVSTRTP